MNEKGQPEAVLGTVFRLWDYLAEADSLEPADLIFVFGGASQACVQEAIRLKREGLAPKLLFSGRRASYANDVEVTEAELYAATAVESGIPAADILIEKESVNTPENVVNSANLIRAAGLLPGKVIAIALPYHMRRAYLTMKSGFDWNVRVLRHPGRSAKYSRETYFKDMNGWSYVFFEYLKMYGARKMGHF